MPVIPYSDIVYSNKARDGAKVHFNSALFKTEAEFECGRILQNPAEDTKYGYNNGSTVPEQVDLATVKTVILRTEEYKYKDMHAVLNEKTPQSFKDIDIYTAWQTVLGEQREDILLKKVKLAFFGPHYAHLDSSISTLGVYSPTKTAVIRDKTSTPVFFPVIDSNSSISEPIAAPIKIFDDYLKTFKDDKLHRILPPILRNIAHDKDSFYKAVDEIQKHQKKYPHFPQADTDRIFMLQLFVQTVFTVLNTSDFSRGELIKVADWNNPALEVSFRADAKLSHDLLTALIRVSFPAFLWEVISEDETDWRKRVLLRISIELFLEPDGHGRQYAVDPNNLFHPIRFKFAPNKGPIMLRSDPAGEFNRKLSPIDVISEFVLAPISPIYVVRRNLLVAIERVAFEVPELASMHGDIPDIILAQIARLATPYAQREARIVPIITQKTRDRDQLIQIRILKQLIRDTFPPPLKKNKSH